VRSVFALIISVLPFVAVVGAVVLARARRHKAEPWSRWPILVVCGVFAFMIGAGTGLVTIASRVDSRAIAVTLAIVAISLIPAGLYILTAGSLQRRQ
jgi:cytochrome bd-type quinol oxidase subunit 2